MTCSYAAWGACPGVLWRLTLGVSWAALAGGYPLAAQDSAGSAGQPMNATAFRPAPADSAPNPILTDSVRLLEAAGARLAQDP